MTENHGYNTPERGAADWHIPLNENFEQLDSDVAVRDVEAALGEYEPKPGAVFEATDSGAVFVADGATWSKVETTGRSPTLRSRTFEADTGATETRELVDAVENVDDEPFEYSFDVGGYDVVDFRVDLTDEYPNQTSVELAADPNFHHDLVLGLDVSGHVTYRLHRRYDPHLTVRDSYVTNAHVPGETTVPDVDTLRIVAAPKRYTSIEGTVTVRGRTLDPRG